MSEVINKKNILALQTIGSAIPCLWVHDGVYELIRYDFWHRNCHEILETGYSTHMIPFEENIYDVLFDCVPLSDNMLKRAAYNKVFGATNPEIFAINTLTGDVAEWDGTLNANEIAVVKTIADWLQLHEKGEKIPYKAATLVRGPVKLIQADGTCEIVDIQKWYQQGYGSKFEIVTEKNEPKLISCHDYGKRFWFTKI